MEAWIEPWDMGRAYRVWITQEGVDGPRYVARFDGTQWTMEATHPGLVTDPTFILPHAMYQALAQAFSQLPTTADAELVRRLKLEEGRVDKMMSHLLMALTPRITKE